MPNWCENVLVVGHADPNMVGRFLKGYKSGNLGQEFVPMPAEHLKDGKWHEWRVNCWGTKWQFGEGDHGGPPVKRGDKVEVRFDTAWSAPFEFYLEMRPLGFDIDASWCEPGMALCGRVLNDESRVFGISCWNPACVRRFIDGDLVELFGIDDGSMLDEDHACRHDDRPWLEACPLAKTVADRRDFRAGADELLAGILANLPGS